MYKLSKVKILTTLGSAIVILAPLASAADFRLPSFSTGWADLPTDVQVWVQRLIDWGLIAAAVVAIGSAIFHFTRGRFEESSGSVTGRASATSGLVGTIAWSVLLLVSIILIFNLLTK